MLRETEFKAVVADLIEDEGLKLKPYRDSVGVLTIGVGHNLEQGITKEVALYILAGDIAEADEWLETRYEWYPRLDPVRRRAILNLRFNLGATRFRGFRKMLAALAVGDHQKAAAELKNSKWYTQVGRRGPILVRMLRTGVGR